MLRLLSRSHWLPPSPTRRVPRVLLTLVVGVLMYGLLAPVLALPRNGRARNRQACSAISSGCSVMRPAPMLPLDPIYTSAMLLTIAGIVPRGLAIAGPVGDLLHATCPVRGAIVGGTACIRQRCCRTGPLPSSARTAAQSVADDLWTNRFARVDEAGAAAGSS